MRWRSGPWLLVPLAVTCLAWATTSVLATLTDTASVGSNMFTTADNWGGCATPGSSTITATADAWIDQSSPSQNKGTDAALYVQSKNGSSNRRSLVRFTLPTVPAGCTVIAATLTVRNDAPRADRTIDAYRAASTWAESTVTWNNQPGTTGVAVGSTTTSTAGPQQWTVTAHVLAQYTTNNGFVLRDRTENTPGGREQKYLSRESGSSTRPQLVVTWG